MNWLPISHRKGIPSIPVYYEEPKGQPYGGYYVPGNYIVIVHNESSKEEASTIAHEFRHHIQVITGSYKLSGIKPNIKVEYERMIRWYFRSCRAEFDALLYQNKYAKSETSDWWLRKLVLGT